MGHGRQAPGQHQGEVELVGRIDLVGESEHGVFESEQGSWVDVKLNVQVHRTAAAVFGM